MVVLYEKNSLGNQPISDGENKTTSRHKAARSVAFTKKALLPRPFAKKMSAHPGAFASRAKRTAVQPQGQSAEQQRTHGRTSVSGPLASAAGSTTVLPEMRYEGIKQ